MPCFQSFPVSYYARFETRVRTKFWILYVCNLQSRRKKWLMGYISRLIPFFTVKSILCQLPSHIRYSVEMHSSAFNLAESVETSRNSITNQERYPTIPIYPSFFKGDHKVCSFRSYICLLFSTFAINCNEISVFCIDVWSSNALIC